jgi:hypothetical protein
LPWPMSPASALASAALHACNTLGLSDSAPHQATHLWCTAAAAAALAHESCKRLGRCCAACLQHTKAESFSPSPDDPPVVRCCRCCCCCRPGPSVLQAPWQVLT